MKNLLKTLFKKHFEVTEPREEVSLRTPRDEKGKNGNKDLLTCIKDIVIENEKLMNMRERLEHSRRSGKEVERLIKNFLPCLDSFERILFLARNHPPSEELDNWLKSVEGLFYRIKRTLENVGLNEIETIGKKVDLGLHEVVDYIPTDEYANDTVIHERQKGYFFNGKLLRVAQVVIADNERELEKIMARIMGIDLGTTNSVVAIMEQSGPFVVPNSLGERLTPSVVGFTKSGEILVGKKAKRGAIMNVGRTVFSIKRHMGTSYRAKIEGKEYTPQEVSAMILQKLKHDTEEYFGEEIDHSVITCPAYFTDAQRQATKDAGEIAGLNVRRIIDEPTAAALAYGLDKEKDQTIMVFDLGGGTYDVSIIEVISGVFQVLAIQGNTHLGGDDFDQRIIEHLIEEFKTKEGVDLSDDPIAMQRLKEAAEEAKIELSEVNESHILVEAISMTDKGPLTLETTLSRKTFESLIADLIEQTVQPIHDAIADADLTADKIDAILLVGGSTRMPAVQRLVKEQMGKQLQRDISPEEVVAMGSAVQSLALSPIEGDMEDTLATRYGKEKPVIIHMTPFSLGVGLQNDQYGVLIERNSTYPTEAKDIFTTTRDFQEAISFPIYEGEEPVASENTFLDLLRIEGITPAPRGVPRVEVTFSMTPDRILEARAEDLATGVEKKITIQATSNRLSDDEKLRMVREAKERVTKMLKQKIQESKSSDAEEVLQRAENALSSSVDHPLSGSLKTKTDALRKALSQGDATNLETATDAVLSILARFEAATG